MERGRAAEWDAGRGGRYDGGVRPYLSRRCLLLHATLLVLLPAFAWLTDWQLHRAEGGNSLSWAYVFLWPCFAVYAVYTWWNLVHDDVARQRGAGRGDRGRAGRRRGPAADGRRPGAGAPRQPTGRRAGR